MLRCMRQYLEKTRGRAAADVDACIHNKANVETRPRKHQRHLDSDAGYVFDDLSQISTVRMPLRLEKGLQHVGAEACWRLRRRWSRSGAAARARVAGRATFPWTCNRITGRVLSSYMHTFPIHSIIRYVLGLCLLDGRCCMLRRSSGRKSKRRESVLYRVVLTVRNWELAGHRVKAQMSAPSMARRKRP